MNPSQLGQQMENHDNTDNEFSRPLTSQEFPLLLMRMMNDKRFRGVVGWSADGGSFAILKKEEFCKRLLPAYFGGIKYESFMKRLNRHGFEAKRINTLGRKDIAIFHPHFRRGHPELCKFIVQTTTLSNKRRRDSKRCSSATYCKTHASRVLATDQAQHVASEQSGRTMEERRAPEENTPLRYREQETGASAQVEPPDNKKLNNLNGLPPRKTYGDAKTAWTAEKKKLTPVAGLDRLGFQLYQDNIASPRGTGRNTAMNTSFPDLFFRLGVTEGSAHCHEAYLLLFSRKRKRIDKASRGLCHSSPDSGAHEDLAHLHMLRERRCDQSKQAFEKSIPAQRHQHAT